MWDATDVIAICAATTVVAGGAGWLIRHFFSHGEAVGVARGADMAAAASIGRLEITVHELATTVNNHIIEDTDKFARLEITTQTTADAMMRAAEEMKSLTLMVGRLLSARPY